MSSGAVYGVGGLVNSTTAGAAAVFGTTNGASGVTAGGYFRSASSAGTGVLGWAPSVTGATYGVRGESDSSSGTGLFGWAASTAAVSAHTFGVKGQRETVNSGIGVAGIATDGGKSVATVPLNDPVGVLGVVPDSSPNGFGVVSIGNAKVFGSQVVSLSLTHTNGFLPPCPDPNGGTILMTSGGAGQDSHLYVCREKGDNTWEWKQVF